MSVQHSLCYSFKLELLQGIHDFSADSIKCALYDSSSSISASTTAYTATNEVSGAGYTAGGKALVVATGFPKLYASDLYGVPANTVAILDFDDVTWTGSNVSARYALIYNSSKSNKAIAVIDFGEVRGVNLTITFPAATSATAIIGVR